MIEKQGVYTFEDSPYIQSLLTKLRDKKTERAEFRKILSSIGMFMAYELSKTFRVEKIPIETPLESTFGLKISDMENIVLVVVLRAAIPFMEGVAKIFEDAKIGIISAKRGPAPDFNIEIKYSSIPEIDGKILIILDPMIATGSTLLAILKECERIGDPDRIIVLGVIAAPEGVEKIKEKYPNVEIYVASLDRELNAKGYILPGLGDAGDRALNT